MMSKLSDKLMYIMHVTVLYEPDICKLYYVNDTYRFSTV